MPHGPARPRWPRRRRRAVRRRGPRRPRVGRRGRLRPGLEGARVTDVGRLRGAMVLAIGDLMLDEYLWGEVQRISPEAPVPVVNIGRRSHAPGGAANVAAGVAALGGRALVGGAVGDDA